jgi:hypothetical protein
MTKRKPKYEEMSDLDINKMVAAKLGINFPVKPKEPYCSIDGNVIRNNGTDGRDGRPYFGDYCNNPSDSWSIIVSNKICIQWYEDGHGIYASASMATSDESNNSFISDDENPLRAAMICFLKIKEQTND